MGNLMCESLFTLLQVHPRWKRDLTGDILDVATKYEIGGKWSSS